MKESTFINLGATNHASNNNSPKNPRTGIKIIATRMPSAICMTFLIAYYLSALVFYSLVRNFHLL